MVDLLVIQSTPFCNINCSYCYLPNRRNTDKITIEIIDAALTNLLKDNLVHDKLSIVWHAGEPLAINIDYFTELLEFIELKLPIVTIHHSIQTNGILIDQKWCDLIKRFEIRIGISVDGTKDIHDKKRVTRTNKGTHDSVMKGIFLLNKNNIPYHAIAVVTSYTLDFPETFFHFFKNNNFYSLGINIEEIEGSNKQSSLNEYTIPEKINEFYSKLFDLYIASDGKMRIREFDRALNTILRNPEVRNIEDAKLCSHQLSPLGIISIDCKGNYSTFSPELLDQSNEEYGDFILGNVLTTPFKKSLETKKYINIKNDIEAGVKACEKECEYFHVCGGGAPSNKLYENGSFKSTETMYCKFAIQQPIDIVLAYLEKV
jgi:uncharacterized protein